MVVLQTIKNRVGGAGESNGGEMGTTVIAQQLKRLKRKEWSTI